MVLFAAKDSIEIHRFFADNFAKIGSPFVGPRMTFRIFQRQRQKRDMNHDDKKKNQKKPHKTWLQRHPNGWQSMGHRLGLYGLYNGGHSNSIDAF